MIKYEFDSKSGILEIFYTGKIQLTDLIEFGNSIYTDNKLPRKLLMLTDVTNAEYEIEVEEFTELIEHLKKHVSAFEYIKAAFIQSKPKETAYSMILSNKNPIHNYYRAVFSTRAAAMEWLGLRNH
ncbi:MAG: hypothetical protein HC831_12780 [Chloroflexia bacterium]|nr:hypothetical protein [Chloroflexia bacterium]